MTKTTLTTKQRIDRNIESAIASFEVGFKSEASRKRALSELNYAYEYLRSDVHNSIIDAGRNAFPDALNNNPEQHRGYCDFLNANDIPFGLSQIRQKHFDLFSTDDQLTLTALIDLRKAIKDSTIILVEVSPNLVRIERIEKTIRDAIASRQESFVNGYDLSKEFGLHVSANAHYVNHCKGTVFIRHFYYLNGKLTALNTIIAIADKIAREKEGNTNVA